MSNQAPSITMATAKSMFERSSGNVSPQTSRKSSKWDKPKDSPPPPVNREGDDSTTNIFDPELPPPSYTKSMLAKFQTLQQSEDQVKEANVSDAEREKVSKQLLFSFHKSGVSIEYQYFQWALYTPEANDGAIRLNGDLWVGSCGKKGFQVFLNLIMSRVILQF